MKKGPKELEFKEEIESLNARKSRLMKQRELLIKKKNEEREQIMLQYNKKVFNNIFKSNKLNLLQ